MINIGDWANCFAFLCKCLHFESRETNLFREETQETEKSPSNVALSAGLSLDERLIVLWIDMSRVVPVGSEEICLDLQTRDL